MPLLEVQGLTKHFGGLAAVSGLDFDVNVGEFVSIIGPNGAGKTTTFDVISGFERPSQGTIKFGGEDIVGLSPHKISRKGIGRTFQIVRPFLSMSVLDNVLVAAFSKLSRNEARQYAMEILEFTGLQDMRDRPARELTLPSRKRLEIARALATQPRLLLLDEVFAGLNPTETEETISLIAKMRERGVSAAAGVEHIMKVVMTISDRIIVLHLGKKIAEGTPREVAKDLRVIKAYLGEEYT
ncbi:MAG: ABC transporter ATP-binding protein [Dehalococcoidia bacterium]|nr:ABC transporter ATP-binding protein [Dehalococcoidia bacterium]